MDSLVALHEEKAKPNVCHSIQLGLNQDEETDSSLIINKLKNEIQNLTGHYPFHFLTQIQYDLEVNCPFPTNISKERLEVVLLGLESAFKDSGIEQFSLFEFSPDIIPVSIMTSGGNAVQYHISNFCYQISEQKDTVIPPQDIDTSVCESIIKQSLVLQASSYSIKPDCISDDFLSIGNITINSTELRVMEHAGHYFAYCSLSFCANIEFLAPFAFGLDINSSLFIGSGKETTSELDFIDAGVIDDCNWWPKKFCPDIKTNLAGFPELLKQQILANPLYVSEQVEPHVCISYCESEESANSLCKSIADYLERIIKDIGAENNLFKVQLKSDPNWKMAVMITCNEYSLAKEFFYAMNELRQASHETCNTTSMFSLPY